jgi:TonB family protein
MTIVTCPGTKGRVSLCLEIMRRLAISLGPLVLALHCALVCAADKPADKTSSDRKVVQRVVPAYPELARNANITGTVRLLVMVAPNGSVRSVQAIGGNPVLIKAAQDAVSNWKFSPATEETREPIELHFAPQ